MEKNLLLRSLLFLPAYNKKFIEKAICSDADAIILDMEDSVPKEKRCAARKIIEECHKNHMFNKKMTFIRINEIGTSDFVNDISQLCLEDIDGFMPAKIQNKEDIVFIDKLLTFMEIKKAYNEKHFTLAPLIETTKAINNVETIAESSDRLVALCLGGEDYLNDLGCVYTYQESALEYPRARLVNAARANNLLPIDTPFLNVSDNEGFQNVGVKAYRNGFAGNLLINPRQISIANKIFAPDEEKYELSCDILNVCKDAERLGNSIVMFDNSMVGPPMKKRAEEVVRQRNIIEQRGK